MTRPPAHERDAHGLVATNHNRYIWVFDRARNVAEVFDTSSDKHVNTIALEHPSSEHPTPDLADISPSGNRIFVSLRGPNPLSGSPHAATGSTPGLGVIYVNQAGKGGELKSVVEISNVDTAGVERADTHGIRAAEINLSYRNLARCHFFTKRVRRKYKRIGQLGQQNHRYFFKTVRTPAGEDSRCSDCASS